MDVHGGFDTADMGLRGGGAVKPWTKAFRLQADLNVLYARAHRLAQAATTYHRATGHRAPQWLGNLHQGVVMDVVWQQGYVQAQIDEAQKHAIAWAA